jgi:hypothetical protein
MENEKIKLNQRLMEIQYEGDEQIKQMINQVKVVYGQKEDKKDQVRVQMKEVLEIFRK